MAIDGDHRDLRPHQETGRFHYLLDRLDNAELEVEPFPHLYIEDFLADEDFDAVVRAPQVALPAVGDVQELFGVLDSASYRPLNFPGCTTSKLEYVRWLERGSRPRGTHKACEGQGMAMRLTRPQDEILGLLSGLFTSPDLHNLLRTKFDLAAPTTVEAGLQKYLHGYEISPHPDIRQKALTWMLNVNPSEDSESLMFHTHYLRLKPEWSFLYPLWQNNPNLQTFWVPWEWCTTVKQQRKNNSIVVFSPRWDTVHAVRADYDHLRTQRTQFYGNLWYKDRHVPKYAPTFEDFDYTRGSTLRHVRARVRGMASRARSRVRRADSTGRPG